MSGLKINFLKSEVLCIRGDDGILQYYYDLFNCQIGHFPMRYLGVPVSFTTLKVSDWDYVDGKFGSRCSSWAASTASSGGRLILLDSSLSSIVYYYMAMFLLPKTVIDKLDKHRCHFFWQGGGAKKRYHLVKLSHF